MPRTTAGAGGHFNPVNLSRYPSTLIAWRRMANGQLELIQRAFRAVDFDAVAAGKSTDDAGSRVRNRVKTLFFGKSCLISWIEMCPGCTFPQIPRQLSAIPRLNLLRNWNQMFACSWISSSSYSTKLVGLLQFSSITIFQSPYLYVTKNDEYLIPD